MGIIITISRGLSFCFVLFFHEELFRQKIWFFRSTIMLFVWDFKSVKREVKGKLSSKVSGFVNLNSGTMKSQ